MSLGQLSCVTRNLSDVTEKVVNLYHSGTCNLHCSFTDASWLRRIQKLAVCVAENGSRIIKEDEKPFQVFTTIIWVLGNCPVSMKAQSKSNTLVDPKSTSQNIKEGDKLFRVFTIIIWVLGNRRVSIKAQCKSSTVVVDLQTFQWRRTSFQWWRSIAQNSYACNDWFWGGAHTKNKCHVAVGRRSLRIGLHIR